VGNNGRNYASTGCAVNNTQRTATSEGLTLIILIVMKAIPGIAYWACSGSRYEPDPDE